MSTKEIDLKRLGYVLVSNCGRSIRVEVGDTYQELAQYKPGRTVHPRVTLRFAGGVRKQVPVKDIVFTAWCGIIPTTMEVYHLDGDPDNNRVGNLSIRNISDIKGQK